MKTLVSVGLIAVIIIVGGLWAYNILDSQSYELYDDLNNIEKHVYAEDWNNASILFNKMNHSWEIKKNTWSIILDHMEIDNISVNFSELESFLKTQSQDDALSKLSVLKQLIRHVPDRESATLKNVL